MSMTEVQGPGAKCSTGQTRPNYSRSKERKGGVLQQSILPGKKGRETQSNQTTKGKKLEHLSDLFKESLRFG
jgi:hypothetical protein